MRGIGQIAELCEIAEPDVGAITNVGPVHLELLGTIEAIAEAKAEILARPRPRRPRRRPGRRRGARAAPRRRARRRSRSAPAATCSCARPRATEAGIRAAIVTPEGDATFELAFAEAHNLTNAPARSRSASRSAPTPEAMAPSGGGHILLAAAGRAGPPARRAPCWSTTATTPTRSRCSAALDHLASLAPAGRRIAVLGGMARARARRPRLPPRGGAHARAARHRARWSASASWPATTRPTSGRRTPRPLPSSIAGCSSPATRAGQGLALGRARALHRRAGRPARRR